MCFLYYVWSGVISVEVRPWYIEDVYYKPKITFQWQNKHKKDYKKLKIIKKLSEKKIKGNE